MINRIVLQNYRQHENRTVVFTRGINAIRAANGMGKTKLLESINYALFGARALAEPLDDVVTRGAPTNKLKVEVDLTHLGVGYTFARSKAGAEVRAGGKVLVTGQTECTKFAEQLFGANAEMASKLMIAKQKQLGGALTGGAARAAEMIEFLADFDLFDRIVGLIQTKLPNGATTGVEARIELLRAQSAEAVLTDVAPLEKALAAALAVSGSQRQVLVGLQQQFDTLDVAAATTVLAQQKQLVANIDGRLGQMGQLRVALEAALPVAPTVGAMEELRAKIEQQKKLTVANKIHAELRSAGTIMLWDEPRAALDAAVTEAETRAQEASQAYQTASAEVQEAARARVASESEFRLALQKLEGRLIKETTCGLCQKDLTDVPEVVGINSALGRQIEELKSARAGQVEAEKRAAAEAADAAAAAGNAEVTQLDALHQLQAVARVDNALQPLYARAADYITLDASVVPARWTWTGPTDAPQDFAGELAALEAQDRAATSAAAKREQQTIQLDGLQMAQDQDQAALAALPVADALETLQLVEALKPQLAGARGELETAAAAAHAAESALRMAVLANENATKAAADAAEQLRAAEAEMAEMQENNALVKKVRAAKPQVIDQLWAMALAATSRYGSQMRGEQWVVSRSDGEFKVNGFPAAGLSGAEEDLLGLSIRVALTKLFLPNTPFMILDEVAAACDDQREMAMLGLLSTLDFDQIILVTHSELADAFAENIINL